MNLITTVIVSCWIILGLYWTISAFFQKPIIEKSKTFSRFLEPLSMVIALILLANINIFPLSLVIVRQSAAIDFISTFICIFGLFIAIWARISLASNWSGRVVFKKGHELVQSGPYHYVRHPIYTGVLMLFLGTALAIGRVGAFIGFIIILAGFLIKLREEENMMIKHFGKRYLDYKNKVKALIPYII